MAKPKDKVLAPVRPNAGVEIAYQRQLLKLVEEMHRSVIYWVKAAYRANEPAILDIEPDEGMLAEDEAPASVLQKTMKALSRRWLRRFDKAGDELAAYFAKAASDRSDAALRAILKKAGISVKFEPTPAQQDILAATVNENVALIRSIPEQYLSQVQQSVMRSVQTGRDLHQLSEDLQHQFGVTKRRAANISRDQNAKATAALNRARQLDLGITQAEWRHSGGGKTQRPSHVKAGRDRVVYDVKEGWFDPHLQKRIWPGTEPYCRCVARSLIPGFI